jgi:putative redox protein
MKTTLKWTEGMKLTADSGGNLVNMDAKSPLGQGQAMTPKELVATGLGGCTAMDVIALLKKHKQTYHSFETTVDIESSKDLYPAVFTKALITFTIVGPVDSKILLESVQQSQTQYCGVSAMLCKAFPIQYKVILNNENIGEGFAKFE